LGEAQKGAKALNWTHQGIIKNRHRSAPAGCCLTVFDFEKAVPGGALCFDEAARLGYTRIIRTGVLPSPIFVLPQSIHF